LPIAAFLDRAGRWFLGSQIQEPAGGVARYYRADLDQNQHISTEITGYAISTLTYLHGLTNDSRYLDAASAAARFLSRLAWEPSLQAFPFEYSGAGQPSRLAYFFDSGIIVRGLLSLWRVQNDPELFDLAKACGEAMARDFAASDGEYHPVIELPDKRPVAREPRWSRLPGCYQLKSAMAWRELFDETGDEQYKKYYEEAVESTIRTHDSFLPGHTDREKIMDRLHAYCYFLEGLLPCLDQKCCAKIVAEGIARVNAYLGQIAPDFARSDVYAQLLRIRLFAGAAGIEPLDLMAAEAEATSVAAFQHPHANPRIEGGFYFGSKAGELMPYVSPVSTGFGLQALNMWREYQGGEFQARRQALI
jgi:hypothetical protein